MCHLLERIFVIRLFSKDVGIFKNGRRTNYDLNQPKFQHSQFWNIYGENIKAVLFRNIYCADISTYLLLVSKRFIWHWENSHISMASRKNAITSLLTHWSYCSIALSHRYAGRLFFVAVSQQSILPQKLFSGPGNDGLWLGYDNVEDYIFRHIGKYLYRMTTLSCKCISVHKTSKNEAEKV